ncbi:MAG: hypothetical protein Q7S01_02040 [bacterium]|nr:hypothetical protein [bacterium]
MKTVHHASLQKRIAAAFMLVSLLAIVFFSFATMAHADTGIESDCPFSVMGEPLCPQDLVAAAVHHISAYQSLTAAPVVINTIIFIIALLLLACGFFLFTIPPPALSPGLLRYSRHPVSSPQNREAKRWLSLFENSPSAF